VVHRLARHDGWKSVFIKNRIDPYHGVDASSWVLVTRNEAFLSGREVAPRRGPVPTMGPLWTDDFSSIFPLLRSRR